MEDAICPLFLNHLGAKQTTTTKKSYVPEDFAAPLHRSLLKLAKLGSRFPTAKSVPRSCDPEFAGRDCPVPRGEAGGSGMGSPLWTRTVWVQRTDKTHVSPKRQLLLGVRFLSPTIELR